MDDSTPKPPISEELRERIRTARALPSPPVVTARLIELGDDPNVGIDQILEILKTDAALAARLLRLANSPLYARRRRTENLRQAVMLLGVDAVLTASLSLTLLADRKGRRPGSAAFQKSRWTRSVHAAVSAQTLAGHVAGVAPADAFLASLLQDIGVQVVERLEPDTYASLGPDCSHDELTEVEQATIGADHAAIGAELLEAWKLPDPIVAAVRSSHDLEGDAGALLPAIVTISGLVAESIGGDADALGRAADLSAARLGISDTEFSASLEELAIALPDLAIILDATAPEPEILAEMAHEVIVTRQIMAQSATAELHDQLTTMTNVAEELKAENRLDALTGLSNRRELDDVLRREFELAKTHGFPMSVLFVDLDDFKKVNDRYGHNVGDELLMQTARRISACVRDGDLVGRFGGEEFIVVLPGANIESSNAAARRLVEKFNSRPFELGSELAIGQTASIGVATYDSDSHVREIAQLVHSADIALYAAKHSGKNQWQRWTGPEATDESVAELLERETERLVESPIAPGF